MSLNPVKLSRSKLEEFESRRDLAAELLVSIQQMEAGKVEAVLTQAGGIGGLTETASPGVTAPAKERP